MTQPQGLRLSRTFPQPDAPQLQASARNRALAVFKYLLGLDPEKAIQHPLFRCIEHSYEQQASAIKGELLNNSLIPELGQAPIA